MARLQTTIALLTCLGLLMPSAALANCQCCSAGACPAKSHHAAESHHSEGDCQSDCCARDEVTLDSRCCCSAPQAALPCSSCSTACPCNYSSPPAVPARISSLPEFEQQIDHFVAVDYNEVKPLDVNQIQQLAHFGQGPISSPLRLHAQLGVWLN